MKFVTFSVGFCLLFICAQADVSELVNKAPNEIQTCIVLTTHDEQHAATEELLAEEVTTAVGVPRDEQQQDPGHPDYRGPYHYTKPKVELEYAVPDVPPQGRDLDLPKNDYLPPSAEEKDEEDEDVPPQGRNGEFPKKEYLPPAVEEIDGKIKRNVHFGRKLL
ncbi:hypothetical protein pipiens_011898 [Culex pipiens pipiens]|uniref:Uncharacterized protein n=1 Tax=Culex pipiens pipiens TaxID=38569 RepID=A0ABD1D4Y6_CULPP